MLFIPRYFLFALKQAEFFEEWSLHRLRQKKTNSSAPRGSPCYAAGRGPLGLPLDLLLKDPKRVYWKRQWDFISTSPQRAGHEKAGVSRPRATYTSEVPPVEEGGGRALVRAGQSPICPQYEDPSLWGL